MTSKTREHFQTRNKNHGLYLAELRKRGTCLNCKKDFVYNSKKAKGLYCGKKCQYEHKGRPNIKCSHCGKPFRKLPAVLKRTKRHFCSLLCLAVFQQTNTPIKCAVCGKDFYCCKSQQEQRNRKTCSLKCRYKYVSKLMLGRKSHLYIDGRSSKRRKLRYSNRANEWRKKVFERDNYTCQKCGERGGYLQAHHKKQFAYYPTQRYILKNGITLCKPCHAKISHERRKKMTSKGWVRKLDALFRRAVMERANWTCQRCGRYFIEEYNDKGERKAPGLDTAHFKGRRLYATRWDLSNALALCCGCHNNYGHSSWMDEKIKELFGEEEFNRVLQVHNHPPKWHKSDYEETQQRLEQKRGI